MRNVSQWRESLNRSSLRPPACAYRKSNLQIVMMEPAQHWTAKNVTEGANGTRYRRIFI
jgi:hypothetical protein